MKIGLDLFEGLLNPFEEWRPGFLGWLIVFSVFTILFILGIIDWQRIAADGWTEHLSFYVIFYLVIMLPAYGNVLRRALTAYAKLGWVLDTLRVSRLSSAFLFLAWSYGLLVYFLSK